MIKFYSLRRLNPYLGVIQVVDAGTVRAYSSDGKAWRPQRVYDAEQFWSEHDQRAAQGVQQASRDVFMEAVRHHPPLPFPQSDCYELWLLRKSDMLPLALLRTCVWERDMDEVEDPSWRPFLAGERDFVAEGIAGPGSHRRRLEELVDYAAKPLPIAQWFERQQDGSGLGRHGLRVGSDLLSRRLDAAAFPELLVSEDWPQEEARQLVREYHHWQAARLLAHQGLSRGTRERLENAAARRPDKLLESYPVLPEVLDQARLKVALVAANLISAAGH